MGDKTDIGVSTRLSKIHSLRGHNCRCHASPSCYTNLRSFLFYFIYSAKKGKESFVLSINNNSYSIKLSTTVYTTADGSHVQHGQTRKLGWFLGKWIFGGVKSEWATVTDSSSIEIWDTETDCRLKYSRDNILRLSPIFLPSPGRGDINTICEFYFNSNIDAVL